MGKIADLFFQAFLDDKRLQLDAKKSGDKAGASLGASMASSIKKSWSGEQLGKGLVQGLGFAGALGAANLLSNGINTLTGAIGDSIDAAKEEEISVSKLGAALAANVKNWDGNTDAIERTLQSRMRLGFADDEQRQSLATLVAVTKDATKALELQRVAMDLARLRNIDLAAASDIVGKVYGGNIGILSRYGIQLKKGVTSTEALAAVTQLAAGQAEAYAETSGGKMLAAQVKVGEAMEKFGGVILPLAADAMVIAADALAGIADAASAVIGPLSEVAGAIGTVVGKLQDLARFGAETPDDFRAMGRAAQEAAKAEDPIGQLVGAIQDLNRAGKQTPQEFAASERAARALGTSYRALAGDVEGIGTAGKHAAATFQQAFMGSGKRWADVGRRAANLAAGGIADGIRDKRDTVDQAWNDLLSGLENAMSVTGETAKLIGQLASKELAAGMKSSDPAVRAQAMETKQIILDRLMELKPRAGTLSKAAMDELKRAMKSKDPDIRAAATQIYNSVINPISKLPAKAYTYGQQAGKKLASGLTSQQVAVEKAAAKLAGAAGNFLKISSPAKKGPWSELGGPEGWGERFGLFLSRGLAGSLGDVNAMIASALAPPPMPAFAGLGANVALPSSARMPGLPAGTTTTTNVGGTTINNIANVTGLVRARDPLEIAVQLSRFGEGGEVSTVRRSEPR